ncbi:MAG: tRNA (adenosine(37)-N6)-threonylcarbamoyltransferase complex ATPase subunit type 1 TsaE [Magnetococcales bacterium]|nr:tRNA (adenosine(37)-N6)-threonylcarbamoyltransferase complex ATPase subunit type 1 TsaE [Magnetococcales bacterium]
MGNMIHFESRSEEETEAMGYHMAQGIAPGSRLLLCGTVGTGKTVFARGLIHGLGHQDDYITSPTFTLVNTYTEGRLPVYHFDLYRLGSVDEWLQSGLADHLDGTGVCLIEWPELVLEQGLGDYLKVSLTADDQAPYTHRVIQFIPHGPLSRGIIDHFSWPHHG